jgi:hypothetical protein
VDSATAAQICREVDDMLFWASVVTHYSGYLLGQSAQADAEPGGVHMGRIVTTAEGKVVAQPLFTISREQQRQEFGDQGRAQRLLGHMWVVFVFSAWDQEFRPRLARAKDCAPNDLEVEVFGDLRHCRHDILHNGAVASKQHTGKNEVLRWFRTGDPIDIKADHILDFHDKWVEVRGTVC